MSTRDKIQYVVKVDTDHLLSEEQIEIVKNCTRKGDAISFLKGEDKIEGVVDKTYKHLFTLEDGRSFTWIEYIIGSVEILHYLKVYHPISNLKMDFSRNAYSMKMMRVN